MLTIWGDILIMLNSGTAKLRYNNSMTLAGLRVNLNF